MKLIVTPLVKWISFGFAGAITLYPIGILFRDKQYLGYRDIVNHEKIHWEQQKEMFGVGFYFFYLYFWVTKFGYRKIPFEKEAYANQLNDDYLKTRKRYSWILYDE